MNNKNKELAKKFLNEHDLAQKNAWLITDHITDPKGQVAAFSITPHKYIGRGHIVVANTEEEGERIFKEAYPNDDWNMAEIDEFEDKVIIWD